MTKEEKKRLIDTLDVWVKECETFYKAFEDVFSERPDAIKEFNYRCNQATTISEFLYSGKFISTEKYLEVAEKIDSLKIKGVTE